MVSNLEMVSAKLRLTRRVPSPCPILGSYCLWRREIVLGLVSKVSIEIEGDLVAVNRQSTFPM
jgi:hypothetical protein